MLAECHESLVPEPSLGLSFLAAFSTIQLLGLLFGFKSIRRGLLNHCLNAVLAQLTERILDYLELEVRGIRIFNMRNSGF